LRRRRVNAILNIDEMRERAKCLPRPVFDAIDGGGGDEITMRANRSAYQRLWLKPRALADVGQVDTSTTALGQRISMPLMLDPCGFARMAHRDAELAVARAAGLAKTVFAVASGSSYSLEEIAQVASGPLWYQLYLPPERRRAEELVARAENAGYKVLCVTIDIPIFSKRERDYRNKLTVPLKMSPKLLLAGLSNPSWTINFVLGRVARGGSYRSVRRALWEFSNTVTQATPVTMADVRWLRQRWKGKLVVKGVQRGDECEAIIDVGVDGLVVSNHGGRNLDMVRATIDVLPEVVNVVKGRAEVFIDGGIRRGADAVKAVALGATACLVGRPYMFGLAVGGEAGVARVLEIFRTEITQTMAFLGCSTVSDIGPDVVAKE
jgi:isopentenyl diphosphate isomerase/L-lactate dehydrogenase-like FMN-dependent dehydrogenase